MTSALGAGGASSCHAYVIPGVEEALLIPGRIRLEYDFFLESREELLGNVHCLPARRKEAFQSKFIVLAPMYKKAIDQ